jgi:acetylornithine aminotransferase
MLDEVQTGVGRTGKFYAYQHYDFLPDVVTTAKALGNGLPIGVCLTQGHASTLFHPGNHGSTFGGNPFVTRVASAVIDIIERDGLAARAHELGKRILSGLKKSLEGHPHVLDIRGQGLIMGVELDKPCRDFLHVALKNGLLVTVTAEQVIRILPPYIISDEQADLIVSRLVSSINAYYKEVRTHDKATT